MDYMISKTATVIGATGLIGGHLVELLQKDGYFSDIRVIVRRPLSYRNTAIDIRVIDFADENAFKAAVAGSNSVFCTVGTTQKKVRGNKDAYRTVDYEIPVHAAEFCAETDCPNFLIVSSVGANSRSNNFYLRLKGEVEDAIGDINIRSVSIFRPSMLLGERKEFRMGELLGKLFVIPLSFLFPANYKPVHAIDVAKSMIAAAKSGSHGNKVYHYEDMMMLLDL